MELARTERFKAAFKQLNERDRGRIEKALRLLVSDLRHPSLRVKKVEGTKGIWEARASRSIRITFQVEQGIILLRNAGSHDKTLKKP